MIIKVTLTGVDFLCEMAAIYTAIPVGRISAILTAIEVILATIAALALRPLLSAIWLFRLHRNGKLPVRSRQKLASVCAIISVLLGAFCAFAVFLVERRLDSSFTITSDTYLSTRCLDITQKRNTEISFDRQPRENRQLEHIFELNDASLDIIQQRFCERGIHYVDLGTDETTGLI